MHYEVKNGVVTLTGDIPSEQKRTEAQQLASNIPNVQRVVNELHLEATRAA